MGWRKKKDDAVSSTQSTVAVPRGSGLGSYWLLPFFGLALLLSAGAMVLGYLFQQQAIEDYQHQGQVAVENLSRELNTLVSHYAGLLQWLEQDQSLVGIFLEQDKALLAAREQQLSKMFPGTGQIRLLPYGYEQIDRKDSPHFGYAALDLLRIAETSAGITPAEVHQFGTPQAHIALAVGVRLAGEQKPLGSVHVAYPLKALQSRLQDLHGVLGRVEVRQVPPGGESLLLADRGKDAGGREPDKIVPIGNSIWQIAYWGDEPDPLASYLPGFIVAAIVLVLAAGLFSLQSGRQSKAVRNDQVQLANLMEQALAGKSPRQPPSQTRELGSLMDLILRLSRDMRLRRHDASGGKAQPEPEETPTVAAKPDQTAPAAIPAVTSAAAGVGIELPLEIFRAYDIRGVVGQTLTPDLVKELGRAIGSQAYELGQQSVLVARDGRSSSPALAAALIQGLRASGRDVIDLQMVPTPVLYFATHFLGTNSGVMVTGSHNPAQYNGLKIVLNGDALSEDGLQNLRMRLAQGDLLRGAGAEQTQDLVPDYINRVDEDISLARGLKVVVDCGNGVAGPLVPALLQQLGCEVVELYCDVDGDFPNHHPDPSRPENLQPLIQEVLAQQADIGLAFDGDGDRLGVVDSQGKIIWPDRLLMLLAADVLARQPGADIIYDVKCSRYLASEILASGGRPIMWKSGHSLLKAKAKETGALLAGELSGHIIFNERWYGFDDALYAAARLLEILAFDPRSSAEVFADLPEGFTTPELLVALAEGEPFVFMEKLLRQPDLPGAKIITLDGLRAEFEHGWGLVRASNTTPALVFRFEADSPEALDRIQGLFRDLVNKVQPDLLVPF